MLFSAPEPLHVPGVMAQARVNLGSRSTSRSHAVNIAIESHASQPGSLFSIERHRSSAVLFIGLGFF